MIHEEIIITVDGIEATAKLTTYVLSQNEDVRMEPAFIWMQEVIS